MRLFNLGIVVALLVFINGCDQGANQKEDLTSDVKKEENNGVHAQMIKELSSQVSVHTNSERATFSVKVKNKSKETIELTFNSGQRIEVVVKDSESNKERFRASSDKMYTQAIETITIGPGEEKVLLEEWVYDKNNSTDFQGDYMVDAYITAAEINGEKVSEHELHTASTFTIPEENSAFKNVSVSKNEDGNYVITGQARVWEGSFMYDIVSGGNKIQERQVVRVSNGAPSWSAFEISLQLPDEQIISTVTLYELSEKDGEMVNRFSVFIK